MNYRFAYLFVLGLFVWNCSSEGEKKDVTTGSSVQSNQPEQSLFITRVDGLRLRNAPGQASGILISLPEGTILLGLGKVSELREEIELRGVRYNAPYFEVRQIDPDTASGWVYGGGLTTLYSGSKAECPEASRIASPYSYFAGLDVKDLKNGGKAWAYVEENFSDADRTLSDAVFILLHQFLFQMETTGEYYKVTEQIPFKKEEIKAILDGNFDASKHPKTASFAANGFRMTTGEGSIFPVVDLRRFQEFFGPRVTQPMQKYLNQRTAEQNTPMMNDGAIVIPMVLVAELAVFWETFNRENPYFQKGEETRASERWLQRVLMRGTDNTPVFNYDTEQVDKNFREAWAYLKNKFPATHTGQLAREMTDLCEAEGWKRTEKVDEFLKKFESD